MLSFLLSLGRRSAFSFRAIFAPSRRAISSATSSHAERNDKFYELRTYSIQPARFGEFLKLTAEHIHIRTLHSKLLGYWFAELGGMNEVVHLWEYDNFAHRTAVRKALAEDKEFNEKYFTKALPMLVSQQNVVLYAFPWYQPQLEPRKQFGSYELVVHTVIPGMMSQFEHRVQQGLSYRLDEDYPSAIGLWYSEFGPTSTLYHIWPHMNLDKRAEHRRELMKNEMWRETWRDTMKFIRSVYVKALTPTPFSPLQ